MNNEIQELKNENAALKEQLKEWIPRRRVRRAYKYLGSILGTDENITQYIDTLKKFINTIEKEGKAEAGQDIKTAIEHLLSVREVAE